MEKVMLIFPPFTQPVSARKRCLVPMGIAYIAGYLRENNIAVEVLDSVVEGYENERIDGGSRTFGLSVDDIQSRIETSAPDFVGVSCLMTQQFGNALDVCRAAKETDPDIQTVMGGCHPSAFHRELLQYDEIDSVIIGEGERAFLDIVEDNLKGAVTRDLLDIDSIPFPARDLLRMEDYLTINMPENIYSPYDRVTQIVTSRGCPFDCIFCATTRFHGRWRGRTAESVIQEAKFLKDTYNIQELNIIDENFILDRARAVRILNGFIELDIAWSNPGGIWIAGLDNELLDLMKKSRCYQLTFPVESANTYTLKKVIHKPLRLDIVGPLVRHCREIGIDTHSFFVCGFPHETREDLQKNFDFAMDVGFDSATFNIVSPLPGSRLYDVYKDAVDIKNIHYTKVSIKNPNIPDVELEEIVRKQNIRFNRSLLWRDPRKFFNKYVRTAVKKYSLAELPNMFSRQ